MPEWLDRLFESKEQKQARVFEEFAKTDDFKDMLREQASTLINESKEEAERREEAEEQARLEKIESAEETISAVTEAMQNSSNPYVNVRSIGFNPESGIEVKLDYNPAFIKYLNANGIEGRNEDETIRRWLALLSYDIMQQNKAEDYVLHGVDDDETPDGNLAEVLEELQREDDEDESDTRWE